MFTKEEIKARLDELRQEAAQNGTDPIEAELNVAMVIAGSAFLKKKQRSGEDFSQHALEVATRHIQSKTKRIIGILHDVVEDSDWELSDLRDIGFSDRIINGVDSVTLRPGEKYLDFIERCSLGGEDAIEIKISDLKHNMDSSRYRHIVTTEKQQLKAAVYNVAYHYLVDILKTRVDEDADYNEPGRSIVEYMSYRDGYWQEPKMANKLLEEFSSRTDRLTGQKLRTGFNQSLKRN